MTNEDVNKFRGTVREEIEAALEPVKKTLEGHTQRLDTIWDQTIRLTEDMEEVKGTLASHTEALKRIAAAESQVGIVPPPELTVTR